MPDPKPKRKWFQFSLRLLLLVVVVGNVFFYLYRQIQAEKERAEHYRKLAAGETKTIAQLRESLEFSNKYKVRYVIRIEKEVTVLTERVKRLATMLAKADADREAADDLAQRHQETAVAAAAEAENQRRKRDHVEHRAEMLAGQVAALKSKLAACGCADK